MSSSPAPSSNETNFEVSFEDLWKQLGECHQNALQELEAKVAKLKKERCLDAQRLEVFYNRNQQLKEQNKTLQDTISGLEERLRAGECEKCAVLEDNLKNNQVQNTALIDKLEQEKKAFENDNRKLNTELDKLKRACSNLQRSSSPESDDCFIPDSPVMASSLPAANKLKKRRNVEKSKFVRYAERPLPPAHTSLFIEAAKGQSAIENPVKAEVLVPNTCELDASQADEEPNSEDVVAETCRLDLLCQHMKKEKAVNLSQRTKVLTKSYLLPQMPSMNNSPDSTTDRSLSLLPRTKRFPCDALDNNSTAKRKKEESQVEDKEDKQHIEQDVEKKLSQTVQTKLEQSTLLKERSLKVDNQSHSSQDDTVTEKPNVSVSPVFKKPTATVKQVTQREGKNKTPLKAWNKSLCQTNDENSPREFKVEPMWSIDPALALEAYESEQGTDEEREENHHPAESMDSDCTWISHSLLQGQAKNGDNENYTSGLGDKANDSLDRLFDTSACGEYKSYHTLHEEENDQPSDQEEEDGEEEEDHLEDGDENSVNRRKPGQPAFAHMAVIRKKEERRKLKGTTCKECEIYYAHLPEEERKKKLSNCSRHRFLYIPPCTPENFWEVGFPSTQTCIERGYIKEDKNPQSRSRRRQPLNALFSPKGKKKEN